MVHQDPFTRHAFLKPRKYPGDAELIDYIYGLRNPPPETSDLGKKIFKWGENRPTPLSVRERRGIIALLIDKLAEEVPDLRILSIGCGHLREAELSKAFRAGKIAEYFALDQDELSLQIVKDKASSQRVTTIHSPIKRLLTGGLKFCDLDFAYSAGLYDYLPRRLAVKLTTKVFQMIKPTGRLLIANFAPCSPDIGYAETFMQWELIYRSEAEVLDFASELPKKEVAEKTLFWDKSQNVIYLQVVKEMIQSQTTSRRTIRP